MTIKKSRVSRQRRIVSTSEIRYSGNPGRVRGREVVEVAETLEQAVGKLKRFTYHGYYLERVKAGILKYMPAGSSLP